MSAELAYADPRLNDDGGLTWVRSIKLEASRVSCAGRGARPRAARHQGSDLPRSTVSRRVDDGPEQDSAVGGGSRVGPSHIKMIARYAHLAPDHLRDAMST